MTTALLNEIEAFLRETGLSEAQFCRLAGNGRLFERLRATGKRGKPGRLWPETEAQIRGLMIAERRKGRAA